MSAEISPLPDMEKLMKQFISALLLLATLNAATLARGEEVFQLDGKRAMLTISETLQLSRKASFIAEGHFIQAQSDISPRNILAQRLRSRQSRRNNAE
jgi:hypothetical protein